MSDSNWILLNQCRETHTGRRSRTVDSSSAGSWAVSWIESLPRATWRDEQPMHLRNIREGPTVCILAMHCQEHKHIVLRRYANCWRSRLDPDGWADTSHVLADGAAHGPTQAWPKSNSCIFRADQSVKLMAAASSRKLNHIWATQCPWRLEASLHASREQQRCRYCTVVIQIRKQICRRSWPLLGWSCYVIDLVKVLLGEHVDGQYKSTTNSPLMICETNLVWGMGETPVGPTTDSL